MSSGMWKKQAVIGLVVALWIPAVAFGISVLWKYSSTPGHPGSPPLSWPAHAPLGHANGRATLVMFVHPQCPCTAASLGELAIIMAHARDKVDASLYFFASHSEADSWVHGDLWKTASGIPGVRVFEDRDAASARIFGAFTSGQTLLYDANGRLLFQGGITAFRGHSGDNAGRAAITALLQGNTTADRLPITAPVFGCSLQGE